jgi:D-alanyl-lipoteichoic acid acyltransferase DltB (MBOAT superfamily)
MASVVFYGWHIPAYFAIIATSTIVDFLAGRGIVRQGTTSERKRTLLVLSLVSNLGLLGFFNHIDFGSVSGSRLLGVLEREHSLPMLGVVLPMGISFYTFQSMSHTIDVYRGTQQPEDSFWCFFLLVSFFPQLAAPVLAAPAAIRRRRSGRRRDSETASRGL